MLETTLSTIFTPGTNVKGEVAGANWTFILPNLHLQRVISLEAPATTTLKTLAGLSEEVIVICPDQAQYTYVQTTSTEHQLGNVHALMADASTLQEWPAASVSLLFLPNSRNSHWWSSQEALLTAIQRLLHAESLLYYEYGGAYDPVSGSSLLNALRQPQWTTERLWITPFSSEMQTAVPQSDQATMSYVLRHALYSSSADLQALRQNKVIKHWARRLRGGSQQRPTAVVHSKPTQSPKRRSAKRRWTKEIRGLAKRTARVSAGMAEQVEGILLQNSAISAFVRRHAVFSGKNADQLDQQPPQYLWDLAAEAGLCLDRYRWALSARGLYSTRKVLFFLFAEQQTSPQYIVKMTREPTLNARLENEAQALALLHKTTIGHRSTLPQVVFAGHHAQLAIVGETVIEGAPFRQQTQQTADCPYFRDAVHFLVDLGVSTADSSAATPAQVAEALQQLFVRFNEIYQLTPEHQTFLAAQIQQIRTCTPPFPLVFQHGDPGPWNMLVTPSGQVAVLDWEAAEHQGIPLWDLFYFLRSYALDMARALDIHDGLHGFKSQFLTDTPLSRFTVDTVHTYCQAISLPTTAVLPLFYTCWMHRALKEATRLPVDKVETGRFVNLLRLCIDHQTAPTLQQLGAQSQPKTAIRELA
ncbi:MAG: aminoglycoside phosphotransferase family protein [Caldilineaceae bacterium]